MKKQHDAHANAVQSAASYLATRAVDMTRPAPPIIGRDVPACPPLEEPLWVHKGMNGFMHPQAFTQAFTRTA